MRFEFTAPLWRWSARVELWTFVSVPADASADIAELVGDLAGRFGAVRVEVTVGSSTWRTSIFPGGDGGYALPIKKAVREREGLELEAPVRVALTTIGF